MGRRVLRRHIWGYTVCLCPIKRTPGLNELKSTFYIICYIPSSIKKTPTPNETVLMRDQPSMFWREIKAFHNKPNFSYLISLTYPASISCIPDPRQTQNPAVEISISKQIRQTIIVIIICRVKVEK